jgi:hypothetical protein
MLGTHAHKYIKMRASYHYRVGYLFDEIDLYQEFKVFELVMGSHVTEFSFFFTVYKLAFELAKAKGIRV